MKTLETLRELFPNLPAHCLTVGEHNPQAVNARVSYQPNGNWIAIALRGNTEQIDNAFTLLSNHGVTYGELERNSESMGMFWTTQEHLERGLTALWTSRLHRHCKKFKGKRGGYFETARKLAQRQIRNMEKESGLITRNDFNPDDCDKAESLVEYLKQESRKLARLETLREVVASHN